MTEQEKRQHRCCFTGHRPEKLSWPEDEVISWLEKEIKKAIGDGFLTFITGMARGVDIWAAEIVLNLRDEGQPIHLICASPFEGFEKNWEADWKRQYQEVLRKADIVKFICEGYSRTCFQNRNEWMVDHSTRVIAVFNGQPSGTKNTVDYALREGIEVVRIMPNPSL